MSGITVTPGNTTIIKKIVIGTPVRRVSEAALDLNNLAGVNTSSRVNGSVLVYNSTSTLWESTLNLEQQNINGGSY
jgi:hypothetical protein